jgi:peptidoglycan hydrolase-like protein with peptidoglycan-binding domain
MVPSRFCCLLLILLLPPSLLEAQTKPASSNNSAPSNSKKTAPAATPAKKPSPAPKAKATIKTATKRPVRRKAAVPADQSRPTKDRYVEIQSALANAGYYSGPVNGTWGDESVKALQTFQQAQGLEPTGRVDALTLIRLDLGPDYGEGEAGSVASAPFPG